MMNRRDMAKMIGMGAAMMAGGAAAAPRGAAPKGPGPIVPPAGPWTRQGEIRRGGGVLHYAILGEARAGVPPVILLHKLGGWLADWRQVAPALAQGRQVIAFDLPGHGASRMEGPPPYIHTLGETAAMLFGALDEMEIPVVDVMGTSLGGCLGVVMAAASPDRVRRLGVISSALGGRKTLEEVRQAVDVKLKPIFDAGGHPMPTGPELLVNTFGMVHADAINGEGIQSRQAADLWLQPSERGVGVTDLKAALRRVECPTLLVYGQFDKAYQRFRPFAEAVLRRGETVVVPESGAWVIQDNPQATAPLLARFLDAV
ncbi:alpha/beta fold hydrolase [Novosphingobium sp. SG707]|uniref:alpha/beta fold hydrolase n=1 Tax=Novosphingobium sp. SG707 TaxID=2586996 RepID=UPI001446A134|nr:alpha/beta fold hydrolase [Novosphingobium sp. SG707]NKI98357.1 pimeloyl-ACP methyl ester carboxylesterase [Novosphingobium sp. SG707]